MRSNRDLHIAALKSDFGLLSFRNYTSPLLDLILDFEGWTVLYSLYVLNNCSFYILSKKKKQKTKNSILYLCIFYFIVLESFLALNYVGLN